jgi:hypothetical protein
LPNGVAVGWGAVLTAAESEAMAVGLLAVVSEAGCWLQAAMANDSTAAQPTAETRCGN